MARPTTRLVAMLVAATATAEMEDIFMPLYVPRCACLPWAAVSSNATEQARIESYFTAPLPADNSECAFPGRSAGLGLCDGCTDDAVYNSFAGPWCYCDGVGETYCDAPAATPEQINLQIAGPGILVASFVTFDAPTDKPPVAELDGVAIDGVTHWYEHMTEEEQRNYSLHFVELAGLAPRQSYTYRVRGGVSAWSPTFTFRAPPAYDDIRIAAYGDLGHSRWSAMTNLKEDCAAGVIDAIVMLGDHAYDMGNADGKRGDAYMNAFQPTLATCPWLPIIGNHEGNDGDGTNRYSNMTFGVTMGGGDATNTRTHYGFDDGVVSDATRPLNELLSKATLVGAASMPAQTGATSGNSRFFSADLGLVHWIALDLLPSSADDEQVKWLVADLAAVDRSKTPWLVVSSHYPLLQFDASAHLDSPAEVYEGEWAESFPFAAPEFAEPVPVDTDAQGAVRTIGDLIGDATSVLVPLLDEYAVDVFNAGHVHDYSTSYPMCYDAATAAYAMCSGAGAAAGDVASFTNPRGTVHITEGNGGVPGVGGANTLAPCASDVEPWCRTHGTDGAYGRWLANRTHLTYQHVETNGTKVTDSFTIVKTADAKWGRGPGSSKTSPTKADM